MTRVDQEPSSESIEWTTERYRVGNGARPPDVLYEELYRRSGERLQRQEYQRFVLDRANPTPEGMPALTLAPTEVELLGDFFEDHEEVEVGIEGVDIIVRGWRELASETDLTVYVKSQESEARFSSHVGE